MKKHQSGKTLVFIVAIIGFLLLVGLALAGSYVTAFNYGNTSEKTLNAKLEDNKQILGQYTIKIGEMAQVPKMYRNDLLKVIEASFTGRYGPDGSKATWQWIQEQNPSLDPALYNRLQQTMEAGRNEFQRSQTELLDIKRVYETSLGSFWRGFWLRQAGYPTIDLAKIKVVKAANTEQVFADGVDSGVKLDLE